MILALPVSQSGKVLIYSNYQTYLLILIEGLLKRKWSLKTEVNSLEGVIYVLKLMNESFIH